MPRLMIGPAAIAALCTAMTVTQAAAQQPIEVKDAGKYVNQRVVTEAVIASVRRQRNGDVWLSLSKSYPSGPLVVVMPAALARLGPDASEYKGTRVRVSGQVRPSSLDAAPPATGSGQEPIGGQPSKPYILLEDTSQLVVLDRPPGS
jgi:hypothetical protein